MYVLKIHSSKHTLHHDKDSALVSIPRVAQSGCFQTGFPERSKINTNRISVSCVITTRTRVRSFWTGSKHQRRSDCCWKLSEWRSRGTSGGRAGSVRGEVGRWLHKRPLQRRVIGQRTPLAHFTRAAHLST